MRSIYAIPLSISVVIHLLPLPGVVGKSALERLYGFRVGDDDDDQGSTSTALLIALRHRAIMLGSLGMSLFVGTFLHPQSLPLAIGTTLLSDLSFLALALESSSWKRLNSKMKKVVYADIISIGCLLVGGSVSLASHHHAGKDDK